MLHPTRRLLCAVCTTLLTSALLSACTPGDDAPPPPEQPQANPAEQESAGAAATPTTTVAVGLTGLILMLPVSDQVGKTKLFMPKIPGHVAYVGFAKPDSIGCDAYNKNLKICFMNLENSRLEPIGIQTSTPSSAPAGVVSVTHTSGSKGQAASMEARSRSTATLSSGAGKDPCSLARWTIDPHPPGPPVESIAPANVLTWEILDFPAQHLNLARTPLSGGTPAAKSFTLSATQDRIELLIVHVPSGEFQELLRAKHQGSGPSSPMPSINKQEIDQHLVAFYNLIGAPPAQHVRTSTVAPTGNICRIQVLGLRNAVYPIFDAETKRFGPKARNGVRTYSCIIATATEEI